MIVDQANFTFRYPRRGQTPHWDKGNGTACTESVETNECQRDRKVRFERVSDRLVEVLVHDPEAFDPASNACDCNDAAEMADEEFRLGMHAPESNELILVESRIDRPAIVSLLPVSAGPEGTLNGQ